MIFCCCCYFFGSVTSSARRFISLHLSFWFPLGLPIYWGRFSSLISVYFGSWHVRHVLVVYMVWYHCVVIFAQRSVGFQSGVVLSHAIPYLKSRRGLSKIQCPRLSQSCDTCPTFPMSIIIWWNVYSPVKKKGHMPRNLWVGDFDVVDDCQRGKNGVVFICLRRTNGVRTYIYLHVPRLKRFTGARHSGTFDAGILTFSPR